MTIWRPSQNICVKAIGLNWRDGRLLATEVTDDDGAVKGVRPLGGGIEFGETWQQALQREFAEELKINVTVCAPSIVMENLFHHEGVPGHEIVFIADVIFPDGAFSQNDFIRYSEDTGVSQIARWFDVETLDHDGPDLYPKGLKARLKGRGGR